MRVDKSWQISRSFSHPIHRHTLFSQLSAHKKEEADTKITASSVHERRGLVHIFRCEKTIHSHKKLQVERSMNFHVDFLSTWLLLLIWIIGCVHFHFVSHSLLLPAACAHKTGAVRVLEWNQITTFVVIESKPLAVHKSNSTAALP